MLLTSNTALAQDGSVYGNLLPEHYPSYQGRFPADTARITTDKFTFGFDSRGRLAAPSAILPAIAGFEFPPQSSIQYLSGGGIWIGGIVNGDTLVSTATAIDFDISDGLNSRVTIEELHPPGALEGLGSISPLGVTDGLAYRIELVDTLEPSLLGVEPDFSGRPHRSMEISVVQKVRATSSPPYADIMLLDYTITNVGELPIEDAWVGLYLDPKVGSFWWPEQMVEDDMVGSIRELATAYMIDNDGDPLMGYFREGRSPVDGIGVRLVKAYPPPPDTNFNWWDSYDDIDYGPRKKPTPNDPWRDFGTGGTGTPSGDANRYYMLSHKEWDFDQYATALIDSTDSIWQTPDTTISISVASGGSPKLLLSVGPTTLAPGGSMRIVFAVFGADFVHKNPLNSINLLERNYTRYFSNLHLGSLRLNAERAIDLAEYLIGPEQPPAFLRPLPSRRDTGRFAIDPRIFPDIDGYNVYVLPVDDSLIFTPGLVWPGSRPTDPYGEEQPFWLPAETEIANIPNLEPGELYFASIATISQAGEGWLSAPVVIGARDELSTPEVPIPHFDFAFLNEGDSVVRIEWNQSPVPETEYYRIYKTFDTAMVDLRHRAFITEDTAGITELPVSCVERSGVTFCYYNIQPYDSLLGYSNSYSDNRAGPESYYWVSAVSPLGYESDFSTIIKTEPSVPAQHDLLVITGSTYPDGDAGQYVHLDSVQEYYRRLLDGYDYDLYSWADTNLLLEHCPSSYCTDWLDIARYKLIIVEEFPDPLILNAGNLPDNNLFRRMISSGRSMAYFGTPSGAFDISLSSEVDELTYPPGSFERERMFVEGCSRRNWISNYGATQHFDALDNLAGFSGATPTAEGLPRLTVDSVSNRFKSFANRLFDIQGYLPFTPGLYPTEEAEVLYTYESAFPQTSELAGMPCGIAGTHFDSKVFFFSFHLWGIESDGARELVDFMLERVNYIDTTEPEPVIPETFALHQNYPNPFNSGTTIAFDMAETKHVLLEVYNILGQRVVTLIDEPLPAAVHRATWNGQDSNKKSVASGMYFCRLKIGNSVASKKMVLLK